MSTKPATLPPTSAKGGNEPSASLSQKSAAGRGEFIGLALAMSWQLALVVLVPVIAGALLSKRTGSTAWVFAGLVVALLGSIAVMRGIVRRANSLPVPKLTEEEKRAVRKSYEAEDDD